MSNPLGRRQFLRNAMAGVSVAGAWPVFLGKTALAIPEKTDKDDDRVLVVVQLTGGNDGLSTVVPFTDPAYAAARSATRVAENDVLRLDEHVGLHPNLSQLKGLFDAGQMAIVQGVSYPNPTRSHFEAMDIWHAGDVSGSRRGSGWLGRAIDIAADKTDPTASVNIGSKLPLALMGEKSKPVSFEDPNRYRWRGRAPQHDAFEALNRGMPRDDDSEKVGELDYLLRVAKGADESSVVIRQAVSGYRPSTSYPEAGNRLAPGLKTIAAMIAGGLPTRIYYASLGSFDTHANQRATHDNLMTSFSAGIGAFLKDLESQKLLDRVVVLCFSEFGRRVKENGSRGTDHGVAGPMFLFGNRIEGGLHGKHPSLTELVKGDLTMSVDFRQVYATVLDHWIGADSNAVLGHQFETLPLVKKNG